MSLTDDHLIKLEEIMPRLSEDEIQQEWNALPKDWYSIYNWDRVTGDAYAEEIASFVLSEFDDIALCIDGLRQNGFRVDGHCGKGEITTDISQVTEKRLVQGIFNLQQIDPLGKILDYEVPLKASQVDSHGDIDLLCLRDNSLLFVEAKKPNSNESILKAILQSFVYSSLVATVQDTFLEEYSLPKETTFVPAVLTYRDALSGRQLAKINEYPGLIELVKNLNHRLCESTISPLRFYCVQNESSELNGCLRISDENAIVFRDNIELVIKPCFVC